MKKTNGNGTNQDNTTNFGPEGYATNNNQDFVGTAPWGYHPAVRPRDLISVLIAKTGHNLFGATGTFGAESFGGEATILNGDIYGYLKPRVARCGWDGIEVPNNVNHLDKAITAVALQIADKCGYKGMVQPEQVECVAFEWVIACCFVEPGDVEPFADYFRGWRMLHQLFKTVNAAGWLSDEEAFNDATAEKFKMLNDEARNAWGSIVSVLCTSNHLATLRRWIVMPMLYANQRTWNVLRCLDADQRCATLNKLRTMVAESSNPFISEGQVNAAYARIRGNLLLSDGTPYGVKADTVVNALGKSPVTRQVTNGGDAVTLYGASSYDIGASIAGLNAGIDGKVQRKDDHTVSMELTFHEGTPATSPYTVPVAWSRFGNKDQRNAWT